MTDQKFIGYFRVSTDKQGRSGLGLEAQRTAVTDHITGDLVAEFTEIESGKRSDRPELGRALTACKLHGATLIVAKLDRLARNVAFISRLMESGVEFVAVDMPQANRFTVHILAAVAEHEREMISQRTKAALQVAKARGVKLGRPNLTDEARAKGRERSRHVRAQAAEARACLIQVEIETIQREGVTSLRGIAMALNERGIPAARGGQWQANQVRLVLQKFPFVA